MLADDILSFWGGGNYYLVKLIQSKMFYLLITGCCFKHRGGPERAFQKEKTRLR